ncbi:MAG TPA: molybdate ABC transporter permease subunit [Ignavibacteria bacterium]|nr:molybdate ABC transporter permease subunit [Ignavibacteria bacterium]
MDLRPLVLSLELAFITALLLFIIGIPLAYWLSGSDFKLKPVISAIVSMPLVLPPTVLGFYLLVAFSPLHFPGNLINELFNIRLVFSFEGLIIASVIYSLPFMVNPIQSGLESLPPTLKEASYTLGKSKFQTLIKILLPNIKPSLLTGIVLSFAHTIGEFGVVLMIGGNIPGKTRVASLAIYDEVESLNYHNANIYALILFAITFTILLIVYILNGRYLKLTKI